MDMQEKILKQYLELTKRKSLKSIASETGIQVTRVFRILNGSEMKLSEFLIFNNLIETKKGITVSFNSLAMECLNTLSPAAISEIHHDINRRLKLWKINNSQKVN